MNMLVVNGRPYIRSTGARSTTLVPVMQKIDFLYQTDPTCFFFLRLFSTENSIKYARGKMVDFHKK